MPSHILVIDDDPVQRRLLAGMVEQLGHVAHHAENGRVGLSLLEELGDQVAVVLLDLLMPEMSGHDFLEEVAQRGIDTPVIVQTGQGGIETVVHAIQAGAFDFVMKPVSPERLAIALHQAMKVERRHTASEGASTAAVDDVGFDSIVSASPAMIRALELARRAADCDIPVLIEGETGVGKKRLARAIHQESKRAERPFIIVDCAALTPVHAEAILFGRERGLGPSGAPRLSGKFRDAEGGTLLLSDIAALPMTVQAKLLRTVQFGEIEPLNARHPIKVDVRLMVASGRDLIAEVREGRFREDLYYRLSVFPIALSALSRRREDVPALVRRLVHRLGAEYGHGEGQGIDAGALALLTAYDWPGNIRELESTLYRALLLAEGRELTVRHFPEITARTGPIGLRSMAADGMSARLASTSPEGTGEADAPGKVAVLNAPEGEPRMTRNDGLIAILDAAGDVRKLAEIEEDIIRFALKFYRGQMSQVARKLGIGRSTLYRKLKDYGIDPDNPLSSAA